jgi:hypothetical protein
MHWSIGLLSLVIVPAPPPCLDPIKTGAATVGELLLSQGRYAKEWEGWNTLGGKRTRREVEVDGSGEEEEEAGGSSSDREVT